MSRADNRLANLRRPELRDRSIKNARRVPYGLEKQFPKDDDATLSTERRINEVTELRDRSIESVRDASSNPGNELPEAMTPRRPSSKRENKITELRDRSRGARLPVSENDVADDDGEDVTSPRPRDMETKLEQRS